MQDNVVDMGTYRDIEPPALFTAEVRRKLEVGLQGQTQTPGDAVRAVEQILCTHLIGSLRGLLTRWAHRGGTAVAKAIVG